MNKLLLDIADFLGAVFGLIAIICIAPFMLILGLISAIVEHK